MLTRQAGIYKPLGVAEDALKFAKKEGSPAASRGPSPEPAEADEGPLSPSKAWYKSWRPVTNHLMRDGVGRGDMLFAVDDKMRVLKRPIQ